MSIVLGLGFGDCGKGLVTSFLCSQTKNPIVVRFNGGHQAGHTVNFEGKKHVFSSFGSGSLQSVPTYWSKFCTFYPNSFLREYKMLNKPVIYVDPLCPVTTPFDIDFNRMRELPSTAHGSVGMGFGDTIQRQQDYYKLFVQDLFHEKILLQKLEAIFNYYTKKVNGSFKQNMIDHKAVNIADFLASVNAVKDIIIVRTDVITYPFNPIHEGAQGVLLDQDFGFFPNVTRSNTTSKNAFELNLYRKFYRKKAPEIYYVTRSYQTRHGKGFMTNEGQELKLVNNETETNKSHPYQGEFRTSPLDPDLLNYALECDNHFSYNCTKNLVITCMDQHEIDVMDLLKKLNTKFDKVYASYGPSLTDIKLLTQTEIKGSHTKFDSPK